MRYFAYCTLLDTAEMREFCPTAKPAMVARLSGYYERVGFTVTADNGDKIAAFTYVIPATGGPFRPTAAYMRPILAGAAALNLPPAYIAELEQTVQAAVLPEDA
jgi:hypothetical protein